MAQAGLGQRARPHRSAVGMPVDLAGVRKDGRKEGGSPAPVLMAGLWQGLDCGRVSP